ncbi:MAG: SDR family oxidoreductase [Flavobacteriales bacterium]|nr:SDR family oxidoreductase [Flavobacteriales bacterium]
MNLNLQGKYAVVCGSTQGIGFAAAKELSILGANVILVARNEDKLKQALTLLDSSLNQSHEYLVADFAHPQNLQDVIEKFAANHQIHILVNNTGGPDPGPAIDADIEAFRIAFNSHLICNQIMVRALVPGMKELGYGRIINVISTSVKQPLPNLGVSNTIRGAVANWSKTLAMELGKFNITVNNVLPGATETGRLEQIMKNKAGKTGHTVEEIKAEMSGEVPMKRLAKPEEIANAIAFLASPAASYINGINVPVDGGRTLCL